MEKIDSYQINNSDFVLFKKEGVIQNGGFSLENKIGSKEEKGKSMNDLTIPSGLFYKENPKGSKTTKSHHYEDDEEEHKDIPDDLYEHLLSMASVDDNKGTTVVKKRKSRKGTDAKNNKTRKHIKDKAS
jgi:hypothetical protein